MNDDVHTAISCLVFGTVVVRAGSMIDTFGYMWGENIPNFSFVSQFVITPPALKSDPVAANVETRSNGRADVTSAFLTTKSHTGAPVAALAAIALDASITDPPPTPITQSQPLSFASLTAASHVVLRGFGSIP